MFVIVSHNKFTLTLVCCISISILNRKYNDYLDKKPVLSKLMRFNLLPFSCYSRQFRGLFLGWITEGVMWHNHVCSRPYLDLYLSIPWRSFRKGRLEQVCFRGMDRICLLSVHFLRYESLFNGVGVDRWILFWVLKCIIY